MSEPASSFPDAEKQRLLKVLKDTCAKLGEHFDSVRIFATRHDPETENTYALDWGTGNIYAQLGQVRDYVIDADERVREGVRT